MSTEIVSLVQECTNHYSAKDINEHEVEISIRIPKRFKSLWLIKLSDLKTNQEEISLHEDTCMNENIKIETTGKILEGEYKSWFIFVEDDKENTGGYLILLFDNQDRFKSSQGYDCWAEDKDTLEQIFKESKWQIQWSDENE